MKNGQENVIDKQQAADLNLTEAWDILLDFKPKTTSIAKFSLIRLCSLIFLYSEF